ncbi:hypothetical protein THASP1DRAFT_17344 [Thamnocephalis sphaerospora]|uniref:Fe2OG dioxygenase domain-containing protein n=1 Tax=Thamnocephalis sphaerospora TaxID=78915 RepID=A0A4P9XN53_9FUNG|nr:hypothetical protein THASP1DRAFT_17344 [Thamnocephalis sphaerospora]|eukprot:RKP07252.1 hypothetical protein THASP1DRAFT_17344 [Thamnocephalis sphaerospora]
MTLINLPVIDFGAYCDPNSTAAQRQAVEQAIDKACRHLGIFCLSNHGVPQELCNQMRDLVRQFYRLPLEEKLKHQVPTSQLRGYLNFGDEYTEGVELRYETFGFYPPVNGFSNGLAPDIDPASPEARLPTAPDALGGQNSWPNDAFRAQVEEYVEHVVLLKNRVYASIAASLGISDASRDRFANTIPAVGLNGYQGLTEEDMAKGGINLPEHEDPGLVTHTNVYCTQDTDSISLQVQNHDGKWYDVKPVPNTFVVNVGTILKRWTGGQYHAPLHRVIHRSEKPRVSVVVFVDPSFETSVEPLQEFVPAEEDSAKQAPENYGSFILGLLGGVESKY